MDHVRLSAAHSGHTAGTAAAVANTAADTADDTRDHVFVVRVQVVHARGRGGRVTGGHGAGRDRILDDRGRRRMFRVVLAATAAVEHDGVFERRRRAVVQVVLLVLPVVVQVLRVRFGRVPLLLLMLRL